MQEFHVMAVQSEARPSNDKEDEG